MKLLMKNKIGSVLAIGGSVLSLTGALINNLFLDHILAMMIWSFSNPLYLIYFIGIDYKWWNGQHVSTRAVILSYSIFTISNFYGLWIV
jgi:hypothetical protein